MQRIYYQKKNNSKAITFISENGYREVRSWKKLDYNVNKIIQFWKKIGLNQKDRVACYLPNIIETVECFIATTGIGAIWSSCSPDFGTNGLIERFAQIKPKILIICDRYYYNGKEIKVIERAFMKITRTPMKNNKGLTKKALLEITNMLI